MYYNLSTKQSKAAYIKKYISPHKKIPLSSAINKTWVTQVYLRARRRSLAGLPPLVEERRRHGTGVGREDGAVGVLNGNYVVNQLGAVTVIRVRRRYFFCFRTTDVVCLVQISQCFKKESIIEKQVAYGKTVLNI